MGDRIKVFYIINSLAQGGAERQMCEMLRRLPRDRYEPVLCLLDGINAYPELLPDGQPRYVLSNGKGSAGFGTLRQWLRDEKPDIVHSFMEWSNLWNRLLAPEAGNPVVITSVRGPIMAVRYRLVEAILSRRCDCIVVNSDATRRELIDWQQVPQQKIRTLPNIVNRNRFKPQSQSRRDIVRRELDLTGPTIVVPGRISLVKNQLGLAAAVALLKQQGRLPEDAMFLLAGRVYQNMVHWGLPLLQSVGGVSRHFRYLGQVKRVTDLYAAADWVMMPSFSEGLCNVAMEAASCAKPLLMTRASNRDNILKDGVTGIEFPTGQVGPMADAIHRALTMPAPEAEALGLAGYERIRRKFPPERALQGLLGLYDELLSRRSASRT